MLHNFLRTTESLVYCPPGFTDMEDSDGNVVIGTWREDSSSQGLEDIRGAGSNYHSLNAAKIRDTFSNYYFTSSHGEVSWQYQHVHRTN